jgi:hypothetical protein
MMCEGVRKSKRMRWIEMKRKEKNRRTGQREEKER